MKYSIRTFNTIKKNGLDCFSPQSYKVSNDRPSPDAIVCRSANLHNEQLHTNTKIIARAGVGVNNIPIEQCTKQGIVVCNTPGANSTAVKELVIASMIITSRNLHHSINWIQKIKDNSKLYKNCDLPTFIEQEKKKFVGNEIHNKTLGVIGLGAIGGKLTLSCLSLGMKVIAYDTSMPKERKEFLNMPHFQAAKSLEELCSHADYISIHIPYSEPTHHFIDKKILSKCKKGCILLNFARAELVEENAILDALNQQHITSYVTDFPTETLLHHPSVLSIPHLGASTEESEENCAIMACEQIRQYLEYGTITHSVNFPSCSMEISPTGKTRLLIASYNAKNDITHITSKLHKLNINIKNMINKHKENISYNIIDVGETINRNLKQDLSSMDSVIFVHCVSLK